MVITPAEDAQIKLTIPILDGNVETRNGGEMEVEIVLEKLPYRNEATQIDIIAIITLIFPIMEEYVKNPLLRYNPSGMTRIEKKPI